MRTPIAYYGGKQALLSYILPLVPDHKIYTEIFAGGASLFWAKKPAKNETINDRLGIVVNFYQVLKLRYNELKPLIDATIMARDLHHKALKLYHKNRKGGEVDPVQLAWAFWMLSNFSHSNKLGGGLKYSNRMDTVPPITMFNKKNEFTELLVARIENATIENRDALVILDSRNMVDAFHYIDPPYVGTDQGHYSGYTEEDFQKLLLKLPEITGKFLLSHYPHPGITELVNSQQWNYKEIKIPIQAGPRKGRTNRIKTEILLWNYDIQPTLFETHEMPYNLKLQ